ncbi:hypothetical protein [Mesorhizobium sp.]|uniref:hypothetical protein n=1 Tax=Mesorhizobium sp. TaxID=1871066 RepID=UPI000FE68F74|nr:hypothetical protein [Mesorhizobium sp.]RWP37986.1 MAG: hypothetical protein EOR03_03535 [Mesorhizobium sp.]
MLVRPNVGFYKNQHERHRSGGRAADLELSYNLTRLEKRIADQRLEWDKVGLPALRTDLDLLRREIQVLEERLRSFPPVDKNVAAVKIMLEMCEAKKVGDLAAKRGSGDASLAFLALQAIEDELYGSVKDDVRLLLHHKEIPLKDMSWWI